jgi:hypothetical protein
MSAGVSKVSKVEESEVVKELVVKAEDMVEDGVWVNGKFYPDGEDDFEKIEVKSPRPPKKDVKKQFKARPNRRFPDEE